MEKLGQNKGVNAEIWDIVNSEKDVSDKSEDKSDQ